MDERKKEQEKELIEIERQSIVILKQTFSDIKEVNIEKTGHNKATGSYRMFVEVINNTGESAKFTYSFWKERDEIGSYGIVNTNVQKEGITYSKVKVTYSDGKEGEI
ncbi:hypothetical protein [Enterococcus ureasiticus]|uniref:hypothetical protein n=1 Tax=Enterococcus ureasiticus TaxID=903984 RepID=UPI001F5F8EAB|nr:hypothetical protein [Enterococcus ureasiticus]